MNNWLEEAEKEKNDMNKAKNEAERKRINAARKVLLNQHSETIDFIKIHGNFITEKMRELGDHRFQRNLFGFRKYSLSVSNYVTENGQYVPSASDTFCSWTLSNDNDEYSLSLMAKELIYQERKDDSKYPPINGKRYTLQVSRNTTKSDILQFLKNLVYAQPSYTDYYNTAPSD